MSVRAVFFDLDGTLADTAPDLAGAVNRARAEDGLAPVPLAALRPWTSQGVRGLIGASYGITSDDPAYLPLSERVLAHYAAHICEETQLFDGIPELLDILEQRGIAWGIVTNKHTRFTTPLAAALGFPARAAAIVSGDTTAQPKPAPDPLLHAARAAGCAPQDCLYIGDDRRDVVAAHAAGMIAIAVTWGYLGVDEDPSTWGAEGLLQHPRELLAWLER